jgi:putative acetyltransferase
MITTKRTNANDMTFRSLVGELDAELKVRDGEEHSFYAQFNKIDKIRHVVLAYDQDVPVGCGAVKEYSQDTMEIKRMFVRVGSRGKGIASIILVELENWCREMDIKKCLLETGIKQPDAIRLYEKNDYKRITNFGQYENAWNSVCFEKNLEPGHLQDV